MRVFWILTRLRIAEVTRVTSSAIFFFAFPLAMLLVTALLFYPGHPFEQPRIATVGELQSAPPAIADAGARWERVESTERAHTRLRAGQLNAAIATRGPDWVVMVTPRQRLLGEGLREMCIRDRFLPLRFTIAITS